MWSILCCTAEIHGIHAVLRDDFDSNIQGALDANIWCVYVRPLMHLFFKKMITLSFSFSGPTVVTVRLGSSVVCSCMVKQSLSAKSLGTENW